MRYNSRSEINILGIIEFKLIGLFTISESIKLTSDIENKGVKYGFLKSKQV